MMMTETNQSFELPILRKQLAAAKRENRMLRGILHKDCISWWESSVPNQLEQADDSIDVERLGELILLIERDNAALWEIFYAKAKIQASIPPIGQEEQRIPFWVFVLAGAILTMWTIIILDAIF